MSIEQIIQFAKENQLAANAEVLNQTHEFLRSELAKFRFNERKSIYNSAIEKALNSAKRNAGISFISACLLFDLAQKKPKIIKKIEQKIDPEIKKIVHCHEFVRSEFTKNNDHENLQHVIETAQKISELDIDSHTICAALLHEIPMCTNINTQEIKQMFGSEIAGLLEKFEKIAKIKSNNNSKYINNLREMVLAMAQDLRVILIKMCSNLHRIQTSTAPHDERIIRKAQESMEILSPIADLLGMWRLRWQLEDYAFKIIEPEKYEQISKRFNIHEKRNREKYIQKTKNILQKSAAQANIKCKIDGRFKHFYSIYQKMKLKKKSFNEITDVFALRVVVEKEEDCYRMLGIIHKHWKPKMRRVKDYIAAPKENNYQSLHTTVFGINGKIMEFQIRTQQMDRAAKYGIASHWAYKNNNKKNPPWIQELLLRQQKYQDDKEFLSNFSSHFLNNRVYVYTPKGDVIALPANASPIDFAYRIHSQVGHKCAGAIVNDKPVELTHKLQTNDVVEIIIDRSQPGPLPEWLKIIKSNHAKKQIQDYLSKYPIEN